LGWIKLIEGIWHDAATGPKVRLKKLEFRSVKKNRNPACFSPVANLHLPTIPLSCFEMDFYSIYKNRILYKTVNFEKVMRIKTMVIILITVLLTVVLMQNTEPVKFTILFGNFYISKLMALLCFSAVAFILGVLVGRPKKVKTLGGGFNDGDYDGDKSDTLSDEDRDYINHP
jgi:uncharacterized integral membrane protein